MFFRIYAPINEINPTNTGSIPGATSCAPFPPPPLLPLPLPPALGPLPDPPPDDGLPPPLPPPPPG